MDSLKDEPRAHQVLIMPGEGEEVSPEVEALRRSGREFLKNCLIPAKNIDRKKPSKQQKEAYAKLMDTDVDANCIYGLNSQGHLFQLLEYGQMNGGFIPRGYPDACFLHVSCIKEGDEVSQRIQPTHISEE